MICGRTDPFPTWIFTHVGYGAGQNFPHHHWHVLQPGTEPKELRIGNDMIDLWESEAFVTVLTGVRAGEALIYPRPDYTKRDAFPERLAEDALRLILKFNQKFNNPDYCFLVAFNDPGEWFARYIPILNQWGGSEWMALDHRTPFTLPWPHEATRDFLLAD
ncbi:MAG: hypothetical protein NUV53_05155 [Patescibacteria group bacterium]|nr:hypothetical protein [Patescibacteria group bacterium]